MAPGTKKLADARLRACIDALVKALCFDFGLTLDTALDLVRANSCFVFDACQAGAAVRSMADALMGEIS